MSIINEALKKAQQELDSKIQGNSFGKLATQPKSPCADSPAVKTPAKAPAGRKRFTTPVVLALGFVFFILFAVGLTNFFKSRAPEISRTEIPPAVKPPLRASAETAAIKKVQSAQRILPQRKAIAEGEVILDGIVYDEEKPLAIINQKIFAEGESLGKIKVLEIQPAQVQIEVDGKVSFLDLK